MEHIKVIKKALNKTSRDGHLISDWVNGTYLAAGEAGSECQATKNSRSAARRDTRSGPVNLRVVGDDVDGDDVDGDNHNIDIDNGDHNDHGHDQKPGKISCCQSVHKSGQDQESARKGVWVPAEF